MSHLLFHTTICPCPYLSSRIGALLEGPLLPRFVGAKSHFYPLFQAMAQSWRSVVLTLDQDGHSDSVCREAEAGGLLQVPGQPGPCWLSNDVITTRTKSRRGSRDSSAHRVSSARKPKQEPGGRAGAEAVEEHCRGALLTALLSVLAWSAFLYNSREAACPGVVLPTVGYNPPISVISQKNVLPLQTHFLVRLMEVFSQPRFPLPR